MLLTFSLLLLRGEDESWRAGKSAGRSTLNYFKGDMNSTINQPMTTEQELQSLDGSQRGEAKLICSEGKSKEYMSIGYSGSNDIDISVQVDKNLDGIKETSWSYSGISGICSNGVVKCNAGTWSGCEYFIWDFRGERLYLKAVPQNLAGGCYCINQSCGGMAITSKKSILNDLSGAIAPLMSESSSYIITKSENNGKRVRYWGQDHSNCNHSDKKPSLSMDGTDMQSKTESMTMEQANDKGSAYYVLNQGAGNHVKLDDGFKTNLNDRTSSARNTASNPSGTNDYSYTDSLGGSSIHVNGSLLLGDQEEARYCEVEWEGENTDAFADKTNRKSGTNNNQVGNREIRECVNDWKDCPLKEGERIKHACGAIDDFAEVASALNAVSEAVKDMTCSLKD